MRRVHFILILAPAIMLPISALATASPGMSALSAKAIMALDRRLVERTAAAGSAYQFVSDLSYDPNIFPIPSRVRAAYHPPKAMMAMPQNLLDAALRSYHRALNGRNRVGPASAGLRGPAASRLLSDAAWFGRHYDPKPLPSGRFVVMLKRALQLDPHNSRAMFMLADYYYGLRRIVPDPRARGSVTMTVRNAAGQIIKRSTAKPTMTVLPENAQSKGLALLRAAIGLRPKFPEALMLKWDLLAFPPGYIPKGKGSLLVAVLEDAKHQEVFLDGGSKWTAEKLRAVALGQLKQNYPREYNRYRAAHSRDK